MTYRKLTLNPFEGLVIEEAHLYLLDPRAPGGHGTHLLYISRAAVDLSLANLIQKKPFLNSLDLRGARLTIPVDMADPNGPRLRLRRFQAKLAILPGEVRLTQAQGDFYGVQVTLSGTLLHPDSYNPGGPASPEEQARRRQLARTVIDEIEKVRSDRSPPQLNIRFQGDLARPGELRADAQLQAEAVRRGSCLLDRVLVRGDYAAGAFHLQQIELADAHGTLAVIVAVLALLLGGITFLSQHYGIAAMDQTKAGYQSVLSQLVAAVHGRDWLYYVTIASVLAVLCLSANTSFVGFPRLCRQVAADGFLPSAFALPGRRLVYTAGILFLAGGAGLLLVVFGGITDRLIPLFAVGAFLSFTLSQAGMAAHWLREQQGHVDRLRLCINGVGAVATGLALVIILAAKFTEGAWLTVLVIPLTLLLLRAVHRYYAQLDAQLLAEREAPLAIVSNQPPRVIIPISRWDRVSRNAVSFAMSLSPDVTALHCLELGGPDAEEQEKSIRGEWERCVEGPARQAGSPVPTLVVRASPYRTVLGPLLRLIEEHGGCEPGRPVAVVLPQLVEKRWWEAVMHTHRERRLRSVLLRDGGKDLAVVGVPWQLQPPPPLKVLAEEEATA